MARRRFRYDPRVGQLVEILPEHDRHGHFVRGDIAPFRSPIDGELIDSRTKMEDHCARHGVVPFEEIAGATPERDRYAEARLSREVHELMWEGLSKYDTTRKDRNGHFVRRR